MKVASPIGVFRRFLYAFVQQRPDFVQKLSRPASDLVRRFRESALTQIKPVLLYGRKSVSET